MQRPNTAYKARPDTIEFKATPIELREVTDDRVAKILFAVAGVVDSVNDRIKQGAFRKTLKEDAGRIKVLWSHQPQDPPIGVPQVLKEVKRDDLPEAMRVKYPDATGALYGEVKFIDTPRGNEVLTGIKEGAITEASIGYDPIKISFEAHPNPDLKGIQIRNLHEIRLWDVSPVTFGANQATMVVKGALPFKETPLADKGVEWDGPAQVGVAEVDDLKIMCAWVDPDNDDVKSGYKLPHHLADGGHSVVWRGVAAGMARLLQAGTQIPDGDRRAVYNHLVKHYRQFEEEPPDFKLVELASIYDAALGLYEGQVALKEGRVFSATSLERLQRALGTLAEVLLVAEPPHDDDKALARKIETALALARSYHYAL